MDFQLTTSEVVTGVTLNLTMEEFVIVAGALQEKYPMVWNSPRGVTGSLIKSVKSAISEVTSV
jgi:hypothetical protein